MATIIGSALLIIIGNPDFLKVCAVFVITVAVLTAAIYMWKHIEEWRYYR
jgi:uncharacterized membrane protein